MSTYEIGAFEALEWAWNVMRTQENIAGSDVTIKIREMLFQLGSGNPVDFKQQINEIKHLA
jgi:hypothetical protein